jgi:hypothetical protein
VQLILWVARHTNHCVSRIFLACRAPAQRAIAVAMLLADLSASGLPVDAVSIAAAVVTGGVSSGHIAMDDVHKQLGMEVCAVNGTSTSCSVPDRHKGKHHDIVQGLQLTCVVSN